MKKRPLRVFFDSEIFGLQTHGGISRYFASLLECLPQHGVSPRLYAPLTFNQHLRTGRTPGFVGARVPTSLRTPRTADLERRLLAGASRRAMQLGRFDVLHRTYYGAQIETNAPKVVTLYDMIPERFPELFTGGNPHAGKREACATASAIVAISEHSRRDLLALFPDLKAPVEVIPLAVDVSFFQRRAQGREDGTILFLGQRHGYKNFTVFAEAASRLLKERPELRIVCAGGGPLLRHELQPFTAAGCERRVVQLEVSDEALPSLYRRAVAFVFPSLYEGFGLPILEAFAARCPVVLSRASCFPEVAAEAGEYFDPTSADELLEVLLRLTRDAPRRDELRRLGDLRLGAFSWDRTARRTAALYRRLRDSHS